MARQVLQEVETRFNAPIQQVLTNLVAEGLNKGSAAKRIGVTKKTLLRWIEKYGIHWPRYTMEHEQNRRKGLRERCLYQVVHNGVEKPLFDAAAEEGFPYNVLLDRYKHGDRGKRLFRKVRPYRKPPESYNLDISVDEWRVACELAREIGTRRAAQKFQIPMSALTIALKGDLERLG